MPPRKRARREYECPVCLESFEEASLTYPFDCGSAVVHGVCEGCNTSLEERELLTCPVCRAPSLSSPPEPPAGLESTDAVARVLGLMESRAEASRLVASVLPEDTTTNALMRNLQTTIALARDLFNRPSLLPEDFRDLLHQHQQE